jgi:hypothetical protein
VSDLEIALDLDYEEIEVEIYNSAGSLVRKEMLGEGRYHRLDVRELSPGVYIIRAMKEGLKPQRFIKIE